MLNGRGLLLHLSRHVASQSGGSDDKALAAFKSREHAVELLILKIECLHTHACSGYQSHLNDLLERLDRAAGRPYIKGVYDSARGRQLAASVVVM